MRAIAVMLGCVLLSAASPARATQPPPGSGPCGCGGSALAVPIIAGFTLAGLYAGSLVGFGLYDVVKGARGERVSDGFAGVEVAMAAPPFLGFAIAAALEPKSWPIWAPGLAVTGALIGHGIYTFESKPSALVNRVALAPTVLQGRSGAAPGILVAGRF